MGEELHWWKGRGLVVYSGGIFLKGLGENGPLWVDWRPPGEAEVRQDGQLQVLRTAKGFEL